MAMNPMQRRARNSFLIGFLVSLIIMALVVLALLYKIKSINEAKEAIEQLQIEVYVAADDLESGQEVTLADNFMMSTVQTTVDQSKIIDDTDFQFTDKDGLPVIKYNDDGSEKTKKVVMKIDVPAGTIVTKDMIVEADDETTDSQRIQEYNMILLPSQLKNGDYIDVRMTLPNGQDYIVLSKKKVLGTNATSVWMKLDELEINLLNNAIVESYTITGAKLYAIQYIEPGMQEASIPTYTVSADVLNLINGNPNIIEEAKADYNNKFNPTNRVNYFESQLGELTNEDKQGLVNSGNSEEREAVKASREEYVSSLEGTEDIGYNQ